MTVSPSGTLAAALFFAGLIHLLPLAGLAGGEKLAALYGMRFDDASLRILMRHRALLFGLLGGAMIAATFVPAGRVPIAVAGLVSMVGFIAIARLEGGSNAAIAQVVKADVIGSAPLAAALAWQLLKGN